MNDIKASRLETTSFSLHITAMLFMLIDHVGAMFFPGRAIFRCLGRIAFPIFAFLSVEGFFHTKNLWKYLLRLLIFAVISEVPYDMFITGNFVDFRYQNVIWTLLLGIVSISALEYISDNYSHITRLFLIVLSMTVLLVISRLTNIDYGFGGICTMLVFYLFRGRNIKNILAQISGILIINTLILNSSHIGFTLLGITLSFPRQIFSLLAFIPILLYKGKQGRKSGFLKYMNYAFYPLHMLILVGIKLIIVYVL